MSNRFFITVLVVIAVVVGAFAFAKHSSNSKHNSANAGAPTNHTDGSTKSGVVLIEYGDYQCSACYQYEPLVKAVREKYKDQIIVQFRNFPITSKHPNAFAAARAAEASAKQNKFWEMHDKLYETQDPGGQTGWVASSNPAVFFVSFAEGLGLDKTKFQSDMNSSAVNNLILADMAAGQKVPVEGTPTFVLDGKKVEQNPRNIEGFNKLIDDAIAAHQKQ
ncbi:MAG TPA: thioredoxin domain-containing protein [Candidatus Saccharimonadales bacterium]|nr:thioredoxin domain-containing protein [Candidatus Saccharimonadales bacterium]